MIIRFFIKDKGYYNLLQSGKRSGYRDDVFGHGIGTAPFDGSGYGDGSGSALGSYEWDCNNGSGTDRFDGSSYGDGEGDGFGSSKYANTNSGAGDVVVWENVEIIRRK